MKSIYLLNICITKVHIYLNCDHQISIRESNLLSTSNILSTANQNRACEVKEGVQLCKSSRMGKS